CRSSARGTFASGCAPSVPYLFHPDRAKGAACSFLRLREPGWVDGDLVLWVPLFNTGVSRFLWVYLAYQTSWNARPRVPLNRLNISNAGVASLSISTLSASRARAAKM